MIIKKLRVQNFRNYEKLDCSFEPGLNMIIGENAQGKTNVLEAIYSACTGRSFRTNDDRDMIQFQKDYARVHIELEEMSHHTILDLTVLKNSAKEIRVNKVPLQTYGDLIGKALVIVFSPDDLRLVKEGPQERRKFLDREISLINPSYYHSLVKYNKTLKQRNKLLKMLQFNSSQKDTLVNWDEQLCRYGAEIIRKRFEFIGNISKISRRLHYEISDRKEELSVHYLSHGDDALGLSCDKIASGMKEKLEAQINSDIQRGTTSVGPHRDDFILKVNDLVLRDYGSQGQHRSAALALKLSGIEIIKSETGRYPIVLLDDVMSELDPARQNALLSSLNNTQIIMTSTDTANLEPEMIERARRYNVVQGFLSNEKESGGMKNEQHSGL